MVCALCSSKLVGSLSVSVFTVNRIVSTQVPKESLWGHTLQNRRSVESVRVSGDSPQGETWPDCTYVQEYVTGVRKLASRICMTNFLASPCQTSCPSLAQSLCTLPCARCVASDSRKARSLESHDLPGLTRVRSVDLSDGFAKFCEGLRLRLRV